jgi:hypothetical protein
MITDFKKFYSKVIYLNINAKSNIVIISPTVNDGKYLWQVVCVK